MKKNSKKILALILTLILALGMMPAAMAVDTDAAESIVEIVETKQETRKEEPESRPAPEPKPQPEAKSDPVQEEKAEPVQEAKAEAPQEEKSETAQTEAEPQPQQEAEPNTDAVETTPADEETEAEESTIPSDIEAEELVEESTEETVSEDAIPEAAAEESEPVAEPELPRFVIDFPDDAEAEYTVGDIADEWVLAAEVSDGGTIAYQWFTNEPDEHGELKIENLVRVKDTDSPRYTPETDEACETYYCLRAVNTLGGAESEAVYSNYIKLTVLAAQKPLLMLAAAPEEESLGQVRVIVENKTFLEENDESYGAPAWTGTLVDMKVDLNADSTMMSCLVDALEQKNFTQSGAENNYIEEINGLWAFDGGFMSGWMGTLNGWFCNEGFDAFTVAAGTLEAGDVIRIMYTCKYGNDLGGSWDNMDTSLKTLSFSAGTLSPAFDADTAEYTLTVPADCESVSVSAEAANKNYEVRVYKNKAETKSKGYKPDASIAVEDGDTVFIVCGHPDFPSMNPSDGGHTYAVKIAKEKPAPEPVTVYVSISDAGRLVTGKNGETVGAAKLTLEGKESYTIDDALRAAHEKFHPNGASAYAYRDSDYGPTISRMWGKDTEAVSYYLNTDMPWYLTQEIKDGDHIYAFIYADEQDYTDSYSRFDRTTASVQTGEALKLKLEQVTGYDDSYQTMFGPCAGAVITVDGEKTKNVTDENGAVTVVFNKAGNYIVSAEKTDGTVISAPVCAVEVTGETIGDGEIGGSGNPNARLASLIVHTSTAPSASNALLRNPSDAYTTDVVFDPETFEYTLAAQPDTTTQLRFRPVTADTGASVKLTWNGGSKEKMQWTSGTSTWANCVFAGDNTLTLTVSAEGKKSTDYVLHIQILPTLTALAAVCDGTPVTLDPAFKAATTAYSVTVPETAKTLTLDAAPKSADYTLLYDGAENNAIDISDPAKNSAAIAVCTGEVQNVYTVSLNRVAAGKVFFKVLPEDAADAKITVSDANGNIAVADADGSYTLMLDTLSYTWQASKYGYVTQKGDIPTSGGTVEITMQPNGGSGREDVGSDWNNFRNSDTNMGITDAKTPTDAESTALLWNAKLGSGWAAAPSVQIIVDDTLIVMSGTTIYKLDMETGETLVTGTMAQSPSYGYTPPTYADGLIFCPLGNGTVQAFDAKTLESVWVYQDPQKGQALSPISYSDGYVYTGFWNGEAKEANFVCLSVSDDDPAQNNENKLSTWSWKQMGGFYWAGGVVIGDYLVVGTDDGTSGTAGDSTLYAFDKKTGEIVSSLKLAGLGDQRSSIAWDASSGKVYFSTKGGYLCSAKFDTASGKLSGLTAVNNHAQSTSTPVVYDGKVYYATGSGISSSGSSGNFVVADADSLELLYGVGLLGYPQCSMLLSTAYEDEGYLYFYSTYNSKPGGISLIKVKKDGSGTAEDAELIEVYDAKGFEEYCITSIICDKNGNLYYKNDSGNVFAVGTPSYGQVIRQINKIGDVDEDSLTDIETARAAYEALSEEDQAKVSNIDKLEAAEEAYADIVEAVIDAIGEVTLDSEETIADAQAMYDTMMPYLQEKVENADKLAEAAKKLSDLKVAEAERLIDAIPDSVTNANKAEAQAAINAAKAYYNGLSDAEKARVSNYADIAKAEAAVKKLNAGGSTKSISIGSTGTASYKTSAATNAVVKAINDLLHPAKLEDALPEDMRKLSDEQKDAILDIERKYRALTDDEKLFVSNYGEFEAVQQAFGEANHTDPETGIRVNGAPWHIALILKPLDAQDELKEAMQTVFGGQGRLENLFWVSLVDLLTGETVEMTELMRLEIPAAEPEAEQTIIGVYIGADGKLRFVEGELLDDYLAIPIGETDCWYGTAVIDGIWDDLMNGNILIEPGETLQNWLQWLAVTVEIVRSVMH